MLFLSKINYRSPPGHGPGVYKLHAATRWWQSASNVPPVHERAVPATSRGKFKPQIRFPQGK